MLLLELIFVPISAVFCTLPGIRGVGGRRSEGISREGGETLVAEAVLSGTTIRLAVDAG